MRGRFPRFVGRLGLPPPLASCLAFSGPLVPDLDHLRGRGLRGSEQGDFRANFSLLTISSTGKNVFQQGEIGRFTGEKTLP